MQTYHIFFTKNYFRFCATVILMGALLLSESKAQKKEKPAPPLAYKNGQLIYTPDSLGNRIPDFSYCGYKGGDEVIPDLQVKVIVPPSAGDATARIQAAIDFVSKQNADAKGFRGVVLLQPGTYLVEGSLRLRTSGVVLRGSGIDKTILRGAGTSRATLIEINGTGDRISGDTVSIQTNYVPVNATSFEVANIKGLKEGQELQIIRPSVQPWIQLLKTDHFGGGITSLGWKPGQRDIRWTRIITAIKGNQVTIDAPLTTALDVNYGGGKIVPFIWKGRISECGVEELTLESDFNKANAKDEEHRWMAITIDDAKDCWVRRVQFNHFAGSAVAVYENAARVTVEDCIAQKPVSEIGGERRNVFFTAGQQTLFQRCFSEEGIHDFATGFCAPGPNAFVQCEAKNAYGFSGGIDSWASGVLFDIVNVDGNAISFFNRGQDGQGAGWNTANSVLWNCSAARIDCYQPPGAQNWSFGAWSQFAGDGYWGESNNSIEPRSLYYAQLRERLGKKTDARPQVMNIQTDASSSPSVATAAALTSLAKNPAQTLIQFIYTVISSNPLSSDVRGVKTIDQIGVPAPPRYHVLPVLEVKNGWLQRQNGVVAGNRLSVPWWNGSARPYGAAKAGMAITRFVPGRTGTGLTDDLDAVADTMQSRNIVAIEQNYGLWYERRRDDHERIRRMDGEVWAPFYELPFARSGQGTAWDGLSKYDLTKYNTWYWNRLRRFADLADRKGLILVHQNYFQHNIIEAGAHYADFPWRPANNINNTGFPEPVPYAGDKRIFMAEQFYDETHPVRRPLHEAYIRQCLDNFRGNGSVIQTISEEFTGPLHFVKFWTGVIAQWEKEKGEHPMIALSVTKDVQDSLLADPQHAAVIDIIDIRYWHYQADGSVYAPAGGQNLAPRQHARLLKPKRSSFEQVYRAVREYREKYPQKAVIYSADSDNLGWAVFMAGGSMAQLPRLPEGMLNDATRMQPLPVTAKQYILSDGTGNFIAYGESGAELKLELSGKPATATWIDPRTGTIRKKEQIRNNKTASLTPPSGNWVLWVKVN
jgi:hypothetical protein